MKETSKALSRRLHLCDFATRYFVGQGLDIGAATDPLAQYGEAFPAIRAVRAWNLSDGDPQYLAGLADNGFDFVHAAHVLQRLTDPREALRHWFRVLKPGGHLILLIPDEDMYEQGFWPSRYAPDNRWTFTVFKTKSWSPVSLNLLCQHLGKIGGLSPLCQLFVASSCSLLGTRSQKNLEQGIRKHNRPLVPPFRHNTMVLSELPLPLHQSGSDRRTCCHNTG